MLRMPSLYCNKASNRDKEFSLPVEEPTHKIQWAVAIWQQKRETAVHYWWMQSIGEQRLPLQASTHRGSWSAWQRSAYPSQHLHTEDRTCSHTVEEQEDILMRDNRFLLALCWWYRGKYSAWQWKTQIQTPETLHQQTEMSWLTYWCWIFKIFENWQNRLTKMYCLLQSTSISIQSLYIHPLILSRAGGSSLSQLTMAKRYLKIAV